MIRNHLAGTALACLMMAAAAAAAAGDAAADPESPRATAAPRKAAGDPLLLSAAALAQLEAMRRARGTAPDLRPAVAAQPRILHLSAIIHHGRGDWRIWLNDETLTPSSPPGPVRVLEVTPDTVAFAWHPASGGEPVRVRLHPNQTYLIDSGRIVEGRPPRVASVTVGSPAAAPADPATP